MKKSSPIDKETIIEREYKAIIKRKKDDPGGVVYKDTAQKLLEFVRKYPDSEWTANALHYMEFANSIMRPPVERRLEEYRKAVRKSKDNVEASLAQIQIGLAYNEWYNTSGIHAEDAIEEFRKVVVNYPHSPYADDAQLFLAGVYVTSNQDDKALIEYRKLRTLYPNSSLIPSSYYVTAGIYAERNDLANVEKEAEEFKRRYPNNHWMHEVMLHLEKCRKRLGK
ncbi:MAG: tetratricopeptide repeat protein [Candidatus Edwardsbacteria bacterium]